MKYLEARFFSRFMLAADSGEYSRGQRLDLSISTLLSKESSQCFYTVTVIFEIIISPESLIITTQLSELVRAEVQTCLPSREFIIQQPPLTCRAASARYSLFRPSGKPAADSAFYITDVCASVYNALFELLSTPL